MVPLPSIGLTRVDLGDGYCSECRERLGKGLNKMYLYSQIKNGSLPMLTYIQDITAAEAQRKHRTPESPDGYFPDRCLKNTFSFFHRCGYPLASASSWKGQQKREKKMERRESHGQVTVALKEKG